MKNHPFVKVILWVVVLYLGFRYLWPALLSTLTRAIAAGGSGNQVTGINAVGGPILGPDVLPRAVGTPVRSRNINVGSYL